MTATFIEHFSVLKDPRDDKNKKHQLMDILFLVIAAVISGAEGWEAIETFGQEKLIPSCILKSNPHIGEVGQGTDAVGISSELGEACAERVLQSIKGRERLVGQDLLPQFFPDMLGWIEFRTAGRLGQ